MRCKVNSIGSLTKEDWFSSIFSDGSFHKIQITCKIIKPNIKFSLHSCATRRTFEEVLLRGGARLKFSVKQYIELD